MISAALRVKKKEGDDLDHRMEAVIISAAPRKGGRSRPRAGKRDDLGPAVEKGKYKLAAL